MSVFVTFSDMTAHIINIGSRCVEQNAVSKWWNIIFGQGLIFRAAV